MSLFKFSVDSPEKNQFKFKSAEGKKDLFKFPVNKAGDVKGFEKVANNMRGSEVSKMVNSGIQGKKAISMSNIK